MVDKGQNGEKREQGNFYRKRVEIQKRRERRERKERRDRMERSENKGTFMES